MQVLFQIQNSLLNQIPVKFQRSLFDKIHWQSRLIEIRGARGVGKTTLLLQKVKQLKAAGENVLYASADHPYFYTNSLYDLAEEFYRFGGTHLFIDEVHRYIPKTKGVNWSAEIKAIYDSFPQLHIIYSGSSILSLSESDPDLSRRKDTYLLPGLSFREFIELETGKKFPQFDLQDILNNHTGLAEQITKQVKIFPLFRQYLQTGYYPFFKETQSQQLYYQRIATTVNIIIEHDLPAIFDIRYDTLTKIKKLLGAIATSPPYISQMKTLASSLHISDYRVLLRLIDLLDRAELIKQLKQKSKGNKILQKPDKIYLNNTNLMYALDFGGINIGTIRETFFLNQVSYKHTVHYPKTADFLVDGRWLFEIGGKNKTGKQIAGEQDAYIAADDIEIGFGNKIPLWLFGFLY